MDDMYRYAVQNKLRFPSNRGDLDLEQLFELPLKSASGCDLDTVAKAINNQLKSVSEESFVEDTSGDPRRAALGVALEIVKDVIKIRQEQNRATLARRQKAIDRKNILDAIQVKQGQQLSAASLEDLNKQLAALDD